MQLTGLLIEYLTIGSISLLWLLPLLTNLGVMGKDHSLLTALFIPSIYVLGMIGDHVGDVVLDRAKENIKKKVRKDTPVEKISSQEINAKIYTYLPKVAPEISVRSSRDRIARGVLVNIPLVGMTVMYWLYKTYNQIFWQVVWLDVVGTGLVFWIVYSMWKRFQELSYRYEVGAYMVLTEKLAEEKLERESAN